MSAYLMYVSFLVCQCIHFTILCRVVSQLVRSCLFRIDDQAALAPWPCTSIGSLRNSLAPRLQNVSSELQPWSQIIVGGQKFLHSFRHPNSE